MGGNDVSVLPLVKGVEGVRISYPPINMDRSSGDTTTDSEYMYNQPRPSSPILACRITSSISRLSGLFQKSIRHVSHVLVKLKDKCQPWSRTPNPSRTPRPRAASLQHNPRIVRHSALRLHIFMSVIQLQQRLWPDPYITIHNEQCISQLRYPL